MKILLNELAEIAEQEKLTNSFITDEMKIIINSCGVLCGIEDSGGSTDEDTMQAAYKAIKALRSEQGFKVD